MIVDFFQGMQQRILARGFTGPVVLGLQGIAGQDDPTAGRVVCYPTVDPLGPTTRVGGNPRARKTRLASLETHVWGPVALDINGFIDQVQSLRNAETLLNIVINAALDLAVGTSVFSEIRWNEETAVARAGWLAVFTMQVEVPIVDTTWPGIPADTSAHTEAVFVLASGATATSSPTCSSET